jgi:hypothetical protein
MNNNAYFIKSFIDTEFRNLETYFNDCEVSISKITGLGEFGEPKNILLEEYADKREIDMILPPSGDEIIYKPTDVTITILVEGNSSYKVEDQVSKIVAYMQGGIYLKDIARGLGNKLVLIGKAINSGNLTLAKSSAEYRLISLKFKKLFDVDLQVVTSITNTLIDLDPTVLYFESIVMPKTITSGFIESGYLYKTVGGSYQKLLVTLFPANNYSQMSAQITGLTPNTTYLCKPFVTTQFETVYGEEISEKTLLT